MHAKNTAEANEEITVVTAPEIKGARLGRWSLIILLVAVVFLAGAGLKIRADSIQARSVKQVSAGLAAYKKGQFGKAVSNLEEAVRQNPDDTKAQRTLGQSYEATGKLNKAIKAYKASLAADQNQTEVLYRLAIIYKSQGKAELAIKELEKAVSLNEKFAGARLILGDLLVRQGEKERAKEQYQAVVDMKPFGVDLEAIKKKLKHL